MAMDLTTVLDSSLQAGLLDDRAAERVRLQVRANQVDPVRAVSMIARVPAEAVYEAVAEQKGCEFIGSERLTVHRESLAAIPRALIERKTILPVRLDEEGLLIAVGDPADLSDEGLSDALRRILGQHVRLALADPDELRALADRMRGGTKIGVAVLTDDAVTLVDGMMDEAYARRASDIHLEPQEDGCRVRFRVDGELWTYRQGLPVEVYLATLSRLKVLAQLDIAEAREPQDGSFAYAIEAAEDRRFDVRMATAPTKYGERATLRLLGADQHDLSLGDLGFRPEMHERFRRLISQPSGLVLLTGPTGSGKTTTLYAALREINRPNLNVMTVEDPIEYTIPGVSQMEVDEVGKLSFASALRSLLRHDPDVLMVGEIRDKETADMAIRAAMTGHLVFSTLHTNTAVGAVSRLVDMQCEPFMVAATLMGAVSQRLVRRLCEHCRVTRPATPEEDRLLNGEGRLATVFDPKGCVRCQRTGYYGRIGVFEMFSVDETSREAIAEGASERRIAQAASGLTTLRHDALAKVSVGDTSVAEVRSILYLEG